jgi:hypothetical protein
VNRHHWAAAALLVGVLAPLPAPAATPLVVGSVRDQHGGAIQGAIVTGLRSAGARVVVSTDAAGTFALAADGIARVDIRCRYCEPAAFAVRPGEPVIAIVRRYDALESSAPSSADLANLPYAHVESAMALRPFTLLAQNAGYPGSVLSDRGLSASGSLLVDNGTPSYDIVTGSSPYASIPAGYERSGEIDDAGSAFLYGDQAGGGTVFLHPFDGGDAQVLAFGGDAIVRAQVGSDSSAVAFGSYSNAAESRQRADGTLAVPLAGEGVSLQLAGGTEQGRQYSSLFPSLADALAFANATLDDRHLANLQLEASIDRGGYGSTVGALAYDSIWSDASADAGVHSNGPVRLFADVGTRFSTGSFDAPSGGPARIGATLEQTRADAGFSTGGPWYSVTGGAGMFWIDYSGGTYGISQPVSAAFATPSLQATLFPQSKWSADLEGSGSFSLPTFYAQYAYPYGSTLDLTRNSLFAGALTYTDDARLRLSFESATQSVRGANVGTVSSEGVAATWQIAPTISLRAWGMHVTDTAGSYYSAGAPYGGLAPSTGALWATYENGDAVRVDAIYRRDLLGGAPFFHVDGDVSGPVTRQLRWFATAEDRLRVRYLDAGLRFTPL